MKTAAAKRMVKQNVAPLKKILPKKSEVHREIKDIKAELKAIDSYKSLKAFLSKKYKQLMK